MNSRIKKIIRERLPDFVVAFGKKIKREQRKKKLNDKKNSNQIVTKQKLVDDFKSIGLREGDSLIVHSSLSKIGFVEGGAQTVIDALMEVVGNAGTLLFPSFPANTYNKEYLDTNPVFDIAKTPSRMGSITELFRNIPGVFRSFHPTDAVAAKGPLAEYFTKDHFGQLTPYNAQSPFYKLVEQNGKILMIGVTLETCTNLHTLEDAVPDFKYPVYHSTVYTAKMLDAQGNEHTMQTKVHNPVYSKKRMCNELIPIFENEGVLMHGKIGEADTLILCAKTMHETMVKQYIENGVTMYTPYGSRS